MSGFLFILGILTIGIGLISAFLAAGNIMGFLLAALGAVTGGMVFIALGQILANQEENTIKIDLINQRVAHMLQADQPTYTCSECKQTYKGKRERCPHCYVSLYEKN